jgi:cellulose synthase/poly-beta-1,6-N-acetylglucosamine synthase-like glycosyltransferase
MKSIYKKDNIRENADKMALILFWTAIILIFYTYFGYPVLLALLGGIYGKKVGKKDIYPSLTMIIAAYNEEKDIAAKLDATLALDYPAGRLEIIVVSDASADNTDKIVSSFRERGVKLLRIPERQGKTHAQNEAVKIAGGEILVFSDATTIYDKNTLKNLAANFADEKIGAVGAELVYVKNTNDLVSTGGGLYWNYEKFLRQKESDLSSLIGVSGCCYALRKEGYEEMDPGIISDFVVAQRLYLKGRRTVFEPSARVYEKINEEIGEEFKMRVRVGVRTLNGLWQMRMLLNPFKFRVYAWQLISHKVLRYLVPFLLVMLFLTNALLLSRGVIYQVIFASQVLFYLSALVFKVPGYFCSMNLALAKAIVRFLSGEKSVLWNPQR